MTESTRHRFIAFISRREEMLDYASLQPRAEFVFASYSPLDGNSVYINARDLSAAMNVFRGLHQEKPFTAILNRKEKCVVPASRLALALGLPPITLDPEVARDKFRMRKLLNNGEAFPRTKLIRNSGDLEFVDSSMFPCIIKPRFGFNSRSAVRAASRSELEAAYREQQTLYGALPKQDGTGSDFVVEELIPGSEHNVETLVKDGRSLFHLVSDKLPMTPPYFIEVGDNMPSSLCASAQAACSAAAECAIRLMGIRNGWTHTEVKLDGRRAIAIECAARMGGGYFETLFQRVYGLDRMQTLMLLFCSADLPEKPAVQAFAAARRLVVYGPLGRRVLPAAADLFRAANVKLIWPEDAAAISRELAGPPVEFNNTLFEFVAFGSSAAAAQSVADNLLLQAQRNLVQH